MGIRQKLSHIEGEYWAGRGILRGLEPGLKDWL